MPILKWKKWQADYSAPEWPTVINGYRTRPRYDSCPECGAAVDRWCDADCTILDPMDYR